MFDLLQYSFIVRGIEAGMVVALIAPLIGIFLVLRRYALIADTLSHVSLAGVAIGLLLNINPLITAIATAVISSVAIERLRISKKVYGESALSIFLSGSLALAIVLIGLDHRSNIDVFNYLFGSIVTVKQSDIYIIVALGILICTAIAAVYKELVYITFDEESAQVSGIPTKLINSIFIVLAALTVSLAIPIVGVLLIAALMVIPVVTALLFRKGFIQTIGIAECISVFSVVSGIIVSFYLNISSGGAIVLIALGIFILTFRFKKS